MASYYCSTTQLNFSTAYGQYSTWFLKDYRRDHRCGIGWPITCYQLMEIMQMQMLNADKIERRWAAMGEDG